MNQSERGAVWLLAVGLLLIYGGVYYAFPALLPDLHRETGWSRAELAAGPTIGSLVTAALIPLTGRVIDRGQGARMIVGLPFLAAAGVGALAFAQAPWQWWAIWALLGVAQAGCLYESVFALLTRRIPGQARSAITQITLIAGLSGTMTFPLGHWLGAHVGGQRAFLVFALLTLVGTVPLNILAMRLLAGPEAARTPEDARGALRAALRRPAFWGIAALFALVWLDHGLLLTFILPLFQSKGVSLAAAALAAALIGPSQLAGRLVLVMGGARIGNREATICALVAVVVASVLLFFAGAAPWMVFLVVAVQGAGVGLMSIMRPMLIAEVLGRRGFGAISGASAVSPILTSAMAPALGAWALDTVGPGVIFAALVVLSLAALAVALVLLPRRRLNG